MPIFHVCRPDVSLVVTLWKGSADLDTWKDHLTRLLADKDFPKTTLLLIDIHSANIDPTIRQAEIQQIVDFLRPHWKVLAGRKAAVLAAGELPRATLISDAIRSLGVTLASFVFHNEACRWLGVDPALVSAELQGLLRTSTGET